MHQVKLILILLLLNVLIQSQTEGKHNSFVVDLIHRDSPLSPFYNRSLTPTELIKNDILRSLNRANLLDSNMQISVKDIVSMVAPNSNNYLMKIYIGSEHIEVLAVMDTGSDLTWTQCFPCHQCYHQDAPLFYPKLSTTYEDLDYETEFCQLLKDKKRGFFGLCNYTYSYKDGSYTSGTLGKDTLYLDSTREGKNVFHKFVLGCGHGNGGSFNSRTQGVVGLGGGPLSLTSQLKTQIEHKFSYCLVPVEEKTTSKLIFGPRAEISGGGGGGGVVSTPLVSTCDPTFYCIVLESISIGTERITIGQSQRRIIGPSQHHIMVDSGTSFTLLHSIVYNKLEAMVKKTIGISINPIPDSTKIFRLCYEKHTVAIVKIPNMVFHFTGADLQLPPKNTFANYNNMYCMMILPTPTDGLSILGSLSQVNKLVEFDLLHRKISFVSANCNDLS